MSNSPSKTSIYWKHFEDKSDEVAVCKLCGNEVPRKNNTTNLKTHLNRHHQIEYKALMSLQPAQSKLFVEENMIAVSLCKSKQNIDKFVLGISLI